MLEKGRCMKEKILIVDDDENICEVIKMYLETTGYYPLSPAIYDFKVTFSSFAGLIKYINDKKLTNGRFYTIYIIGLLNKEPKLGYLLVEDGIEAGMK